LLLGIQVIDLGSASSKLPIQNLPNLKKGDSFYIIVVDPLENGKGIL